MDSLDGLSALQDSLGSPGLPGNLADSGFVRIVRLSLCSDCGDQFVDLFEQFKVRIAGHAGCRFVYLLRCGDTFFTVSGWDRPEDLETYRTSELFRGVWKITRSWLSEPAQAWSCPIASWAAGAEESSPDVQI
jgi:heme-degrading monooxygenase HmoA